MNFRINSSRVRKAFKPRLKTKLYLTNRVPHSYYSLRSFGCAFLSAKILETARRKLTRKFKDKKLRGYRKLSVKKNKNFCFSPLFPQAPRTSKKLGIRMGKGKGAISSWVFPLEKNRPLFNYRGLLPIFRVKRFVRKIKHRFPVRTQLLVNKVKIKKFLFIKSTSSYKKWGNLNLEKNNKEKN